MNKRIDNLIAQATYVSESDDPDYRYESFDKKKFAELIIIECAKKVLAAYDDDHKPIWGVQDMAEHFGISRSDLKKFGIRV